MDTPENPKDPPVPPPAPASTEKAPRKRKPKPPAKGLLDSLQKNCASCEHFLRTGEDTGDCYGVPPTVIVLEGAEGPYPQSIRPDVSPDDKACGTFKFAM